MIKTDDTDEAILNLLARNGRISNREVGRLLNISEGTVRQRIKKLTEAKVMRLGLVTDMAAVGFSASVIVRLKTKPDQARKIANALAQIECCKFVGLTLGRFDVIAFFVAQTRLELSEKVDACIAEMPGIIAIDLREPVGAAKHRYDLVYLT